MIKRNRIIDAPYFYESAAEHGAVKKQNDGAKKQTQRKQRVHDVLFRYFAPVLRRFTRNRNKTFSAHPIALEQKGD